MDSESGESTQEHPYGVFREAFAIRNLPDRLVTLGNYLSVAKTLDAHGLMRYVREGNDSGYATGEMRDSRAALGRTRQIDALNQGRKWARERFLAELDPMLAPEIALVIVPSHDPYLTDTPLRALAQELATRAERFDATGVLVRHTKIKRISYGGPSYRALHRETITVRDTERIAGRTVLLLDDIARSGASLRACRDMLLEAGATTVQAMALGRVI